jgi:predicted porin
VWRHDFGGTSVTFQPYFGKATADVPDASTGGHIKTDLDQLAGVNVVAEMGAWTARAGYMQTNLTYRSPQVTPLFAGLRQINALVPGAAALADSLDSIDKKITFTGVGVGYDGGNVFAQAEYGRRKCDLFLADTTSWYVTAGYRFGNFMPHVTISQVKTDSPLSQSVVPAVGPLAAVAIGVNTLMSGQNPAQKAIALGARYQFAKSADVKLQWDRVDVPAGATGNFTRPQPGFGGSAVNVYSLSVDFVF